LQASLNSWSLRDRGREIQIRLAGVKLDVQVAVILHLYILRRKDSKTYLAGNLDYGNLEMMDIQIKTLQKAEYSEFCIFAKFETQNVLYLSKIRI